MKNDKLSISEKKELLKIQGNKEKFKQEQKLLAKKAKHENDIHEKENELIEKKRSIAVANNIDLEISEISQQPIPDSVDELINLINQFFLKGESISVFPYISEEKKDINKAEIKLLKIYKSKIVLALNKLKSKNIETYEVNHYDKELSRLKRKILIRSYGPVVVISILIITALAYLQLIK